ncbi:peptidase C65 Otubain-domain-containing protein [Ephemerocybe angulata]|uniref:ubiquitinyl hydrolase 1 n=1 Tax=Ephemerocybe angulata TaxID=980116 RepID=A0A8H6HS42_9AGAR|nr:peptidase C65 Otubain-domain-containing protein [Tulosesus angulatus]
MSSEQQTTESQLKDYSVSEVYDMNQRLLNESIPDVAPVSEVAPISVLREEYERGSQTFLSQIDWLSKQGYTAFRRAKGDGDCFYRSVAFAYLEQLIQTPPQEQELTVSTSLSLLASTKENIINAGTQAIVVDDAFEEFEALIKNVIVPDAQGRILTSKRLLEIFQARSSGNNYAIEDASIPPNIVFYLRLLTRAQLKGNASNYDGFLYDAETGDPMDAESFCNRYVDPVGIEADHMQMTALCRELKLNLDVAYLDGRQADNVDFVQFREGPETQKPLTLLYRPGHYDILVKETKV